MKSITTIKSLLSLAISLAYFTALSASAADSKKGDKTSGDCKKCPLTQAGGKPSPREAKKCAKHKKQCESQRARITDQKRSERRTLPPEAQKFVERMRGFHQEIGELYRAGKRDEAREVTEKLREFVQDHAELARQAGPAMRARHHGQHPAHRPPHVKRGEQVEDKVHDSRRRIELLAQAAENLDQVGLPKEANNVRQQAERIARELQASSHHSRSHGQQLAKEVQELRKMLEQMKKEIAALKKERR